MPQFDRDLTDAIVATESLEITTPVPTLGDLTPATGPSFGGTIVRIRGSGFRLPTPPVATGPTTPPAYPSVEVLFGGVPAERVDVFSTTELWVRTPLVPPGVTSVTVRNVDDTTGVPIPGESRTRAGLWTSVRPGLHEDAESDVTRVVRRLVTMMRDGIIEEVVTGKHIDYAEDGEPHVVAIAKLPSLALVGPGMPENRMHTLLDPVELETADGELVVKPPPFVVDLTFTVVGTAETLAQMVRLEALTLRFFERIKDVDIDRDPDDLSLGKVAFELELLSREPGPSSRTRPNMASLHSFAFDLVVRGVPIEGTPGFPDRETDNVSERTGFVDAVGVRLGGGARPDENVIWPPNTDTEQFG